MPEPIRTSFEVDCSRAHAFDTWTTRISTWWPRSHTVSADPDASVLLERRVGGRIFERTATGVEHDWGEVTAFDPPRRLSYLWHIRRDRADATEVAISFHEIGDDRTRVEIEHRGWERLGDGAESWRERNLTAWRSLLPHYREAVASGPPNAR
jgi:uncharacterized protein YndB with AHSA1/START domain